jgi:hypothetical protein
MPGTWMKFTRGRGCRPGAGGAWPTSASRTWFRRLGRRVHGPARRRHAHPPARRRALRRLPVGRRRFEHHRRPDGAPCGPAGQDLLHRLRRPALRRIGVCAAGGAALRLRHTSEIAELNMLAQWPRVLHHLDQPHGDASFMPTLRVSELAAEACEGGADRRRRRRAVCGLRQIRAFFARPDAPSLSADAFQRRYFDSISLFSPEAKLALYRPEVRRQLAGIDSFTAAASPGSTRRSTSTASTRRCTWTCSCCCPATTWSSPTAWAWR